jgi:putative flippase GtrA
MPEFSARLSNYALRVPKTSSTNAILRLVQRFRGQFAALFREVAKFGVVGLGALVVDIGLFNLLRFSGGQGPMYDRPISAKIVSVAVATVVAYFGNRYWTFRNRGRSRMSRELAMFFLLNGVGMLIAITCLYVSHYVLGLTSALADNLSANVIGLGLGTLFRFWSYRKWVFPELPDNAADRELAERDASTLI